MWQEKASVIYKSKIQSLCIHWAAIRIYAQPQMYQIYTHYENMPIQNYWKFYNQKSKIFR